MKTCEPCGILCESCGLFYRKARMETAKGAKVVITGEHRGSLLRGIPNAVSWPEN